MTTQTSEQQPGAEAPTPQTAALAPVEDAEILRIKNDRALTEFSSPFASAAAYRHFNAIAEIFSRSAFVPEHFRGKPGECLIAIDIARRMGEGELAVMQSMFVVKGRPGFYTNFMVARANRHAGFQSTIKWEREDLGGPVEVSSKGGKYKIPNMRVTAWAIDRFGDKIEASVDTNMAIEEGWIDNAKYKSMPEHMFRWRSAAMLIRLYAPEVMSGVPVVEELETMKDVTGRGSVVGLDSVVDLPAAGPLSASDLINGTNGTGTVNGEPSATQEPAQAAADREPGEDDDEGNGSPPAGKAGLFDQPA